MLKFFWPSARIAQQCARAIVLAVALAAASAPLIWPSAAAAQARDQWGLTERDWLTKGGADLRAAAGFPGAFPRVLAAAQAGDAKAAALLAGAYAVGSGTPVNHDEGFRWAKVASDKGLPFGHFALALKYRDGTGAARNAPLYIQLAWKAANAGHIAAKFELAMGITPSTETRDNAPTWLDRRKLLSEAAAAGHPGADRALRAMEANIRFSEALNGKPLWKDSRGLLLGHVDWAMPDHPCLTMIRSTRGQMWAIPWKAVRVYRPQATSFVVEGEVVANNPYFVAVGAMVDITRIWGFVLLENNTNYTPERTREIFAGMERDANEIIGSCL